MLRGQGDVAQMQFFFFGLINLMETLVSYMMAPVSLLAHVALISALP